MLQSYATVMCYSYNICICTCRHVQYASVVNGSNPSHATDIKEQEIVTADEFCDSGQGNRRGKELTRD